MRVPPAPLLLSLVAVAAAGVAHGMFTDRWGPSGQLQQALAALPRVPAAFGDWAGEERSLTADAMAVGGIKGAVYRQYKNPRTGETVQFLIVCGRGGPITVHTPDVCYGGAGYQRIGEVEAGSVEAAGQTDTFAVGRFRKTGVVPTRLEIYWAWSRDGAAWQAPSNPRAALARSPALYKMYVIREFAPGSQAEGTNSCENFLRRALPDIRNTLPHAGS
jgi:hypothetical protein